MKQAVIGVLAVQGDVREHVRALEAAGAQAVPVRYAHDVAKIDGLVIPGGESTAIFNLLEVFDMLEPIRQRIADGMPAYGSCAGLILLADQIVGGKAGQVGIGGMDVTARRNAFGRQVDSFEVDLLMKGLSPVGTRAEIGIGSATLGGSAPVAVPSSNCNETVTTGCEISHINRPIRTVFIRAPWIEQWGDEVEVLARIPAHDVYGNLLPAAAVGKVVAARQANLLVTAFHPEVTGDLRVHELFVKMVLSQLR